MKYYNEYFSFFCIYAFIMFYAYSQDQSNAIILFIFSLFLLLLTNEKIVLNIFAIIKKVCYTVFTG